MIVDFDTNTYSDPWFQSLPPLSQHVFIYCFTNTHRNVLCLYFITEKTISFETNVPLCDIPDILASLEPKVKYDRSCNLLMVINGFKRQYCRTGIVSPKIMIAAQKNLLLLPQEHAFVSEFLNKYRSLGIVFTYPIDTLLGDIDRVQVQGKGTGKGYRVEEQRQGEYDNRKKQHAV